MKCSILSDLYCKTKLVVDSQCCDVEWLLIEEFPITIIVGFVMEYILLSKKKTVMKICIYKLYDFFRNL